MDEINRTVARPLGYHVDLIGWEDTLSAAGRPQAIINEELKTCQMFIGMIWSKWGTKPSLSGPYTSGFEEEFSIAMEGNRNSGVPFMRMFFKDVDESQTKDPGPELSKVLRFKTDVIERKEILFDTFESIDSFTSKVRLCLADYIHRISTSSNDGEEVKEAPDSADQAPTDALSDKSQSDISNEATFLRHVADLLSISVTASGLQDLDVARARNLFNSLAWSSNDELMVQAHDANLVYQRRSELMLSGREESHLADAGLVGLENENVPLWTWLSRRMQAVPGWLTYSTRVGSAQVRIGAFKSLLLLNRGVDEIEIEPSRDALIRKWFSNEDATSSSKVAALRYLGGCGRREDIDVIKDEISAADVSTLGAALEAGVTLLTRFDASAAASFVIDNSFDQLEEKTLKAALRGFQFVEAEKLNTAFQHRSPDVRVAALAEMDRRNLLGEAELNRAKGDTSARVRKAALEILVRKQGHLSDDLAKSILVMDSGKRSVFSSSSSSGENFLTEYKKSKLLSLPLPELKKLSERRLTGGINAYFAAAEVSFTTESTQLRSDFDDGFNHFFDCFVSELRNLSGGKNEGDEFVSEFLSNKRGYVRTWTRRALDIFEKRGGARDLDRVRKAIDSDNIDPTLEDILYLGRFGAREDGLRVIRLIEKWTGGRGAVGLLTAPAPNAVAAATILKLLGGDLSSALSPKVSGSLASAMILKASKSSFEALRDDEIEELLYHEKEEVRRASALKCISTFKKSKTLAILEKYLNARKYRFYNVIFWLDLAVSFPLRTAQEVATRKIAQLTSA